MADAPDLHRPSAPDESGRSSAALSSALSIAAFRAAIARNSLAVLIGALVAANILRVGNNLILTRILAPEAFGVVGVITAITVIMTLITDLGFNIFIIRSSRGDDPRLLNVVWTIRLARSFLLTAAMFFGAGLLAAAFDKPELTAPIRATSFLFLLGGVQSLAFISAQRQRRVSFISVVEFANAVVQMAATITLALILRSYWALVLGMYAGALSKVVFSYVLFPGYGHRIAFDKKVADELWAIARVVVISSIITIIIGQADKVVIGRMLTLDTLGLYMLAASLTAAAMQLITTYVGRMLLPEYAEAARHSVEALRNIYYAGRWRMTLTLAFLLGGGVGGGGLVVRVLFDERYLGAGIFVSLLCIGPLLSLITRPAEQALISLGTMRSALEANAIRLAWLAITGPLGFHYFGVTGLVAAFATIELPATFYWWARLKMAGLFSIAGELPALGAAALGGAIGLGAEWLAESLIARGVLPNF